MLDICRSLVLYCLHSLHSLIWRRTARPHAILSLPVEILTEAFTYLDFTGVLAVKLTCKTFYSAVNTRQFWHNRIETLTQAHCVCPPEDELENYTVSELEQWTLRRDRALNVWASSRKPHFRKRTVELPSGGLSLLDSTNFVLIPGGRWLLIHYHSAVVYYVDLDCPEPTPQTLFDPHKIDDQIRDPQFTTLVTWIDKASPRLSLWLVCLVNTNDVARTYTSRIDMVGCGAGATLVASNIIVFRNFDLDLCVAGIAINNRYLVQAWSNQSNVGQIGIYEHGPALGCLDYPITHDSDHHASDVANITMMEFIYDNILAIHSMKTSFLFIFEVGSSSSLILLHRITMSIYPWSTPRWTPDSAVITMMNDERLGDIQGLVIPRDTSYPPVIIELGSLQVEPERCILGTRLLVTKKWPQHKFFKYGWDLATPAKQPSPLLCIFEKEFSPGFLTFDEDVGCFLTYPAPCQVDIFNII